MVTRRLSAKCRSSASSSRPTSLPGAGAHRSAVVLLTTRSRVARLVHPELAATRQPHVRQQPPTLVVHGVADDVPALHLTEEVLHVGTHQVELVRRALVVLVHGHLGG